MVCGPDQVPAIDDPQRAASDPCTTALAAIIRQEDRGQLEAFAKAVSYLEPDQARFYAGLVLRALADTPRRTLEGIMATAQYDYWAELRQEGRQEGDLAATTRAILTVLGTRGLDIPAAVRERVEGCRDVDRLKVWLQRAVTVDRADDLFT